MSAFIAAVLSFPTVVFTVMLGLCLLYALATLLGAADLESLDGMLGIDDTNDTFAENVLNALGIAGVPITIFGSVSTVFAWITSIAAMKFIPDTFASSWLVGGGSALAGLVLGVFAVRPLRGLFDGAQAPQRAGIVGKICTIRSLRVDGTSGTAEVEDGGAGFIAEVRCPRENELTRGSKAIVYDYDSTEGIYFVGPIDPSIARSDFDQRVPADLGRGTQSEIA